MTWQYYSPSTFQAGDVIQIHRGAGVPQELEGKWWRVIKGSGSRWELDGPYEDEALTVRVERRRRPR